MTVCPLGLCRTEETCPRAPCLDCMRRLGEHMIDEIKIIGRQAQAASDKGDVGAFNQLHTMLQSLGVSMTSRELAQI